MTMIYNVNFQGLYDVSDGDEEFLLSVLLVIEKNLSEFPKQLQELLNDNEIISFSKKAHKLKSSTAYLGHHELEGLLLIMEDGKDLSKEVLQGHLNEFNSIVEIVLGDVQAKIEELG
ncbi:hypothetical protein MY04_2078 [Flammeovirga sp. MY04]|uniref:hypothetical protein n=1 Tax=Flammeovirga sp. MY04 TaxID=1191459 RepID=UPI0008061CC6|nr:hypothetical protein [Flammeovirga sp. MY04]ANQ49452.1 hypothetical protein MY04_2078 [Flammeovirga sp. MY04]